MAIPSFNPKISVILRKVPRRDGAARVSYLAAGVIPEIDLTPYLGEQGGVVTNRGIHQAGGAFSITLADRMDQKSQDTLYASIEPMDMVEIRMARVQKGSTLPIVMRGFVSHVERVESVGQDGRPARTVHVTGHDYGKLLQIMQISYQKEYIYGRYLLTSFPMIERYGVLYNGTAKKFVEDTMSHFVNDFLGDMFLFSGLEQAPVFLTDASVTGARVGPYGIPNFEGSIWQLLSNWTDIGWNELYIEDREDAAYLVYRPVPYYDLAGNLIMADQGAKAPPEIRVTAAEVEMSNMARSDQNVANFFQVDAPQAEILNMDWVRTQATQNGLVLDIGYRNNQLEIYGLKRMPARSNQASDDGTTETATGSVSDKTAQASSAGAWYKQRVAQLKAINRDNVVYEEGSLSMRGNEAIRPGNFIRLERGGLNSRYYVTHVTQQFNVYQSFKTTLQLSRGEGYIDRLNAHSSPYVGEKGKGAYG